MKNLGPYRLNPTGKFNPEKQYRFLDMLEYNGSSYVCINDDIIDGVSNIGVLPVGEEKSEIYFQLIASCGAEGPRAEKYDGFVKLTNESPVWDYNVTDKIIIGHLYDSSTPIEIINAYDGCCGMIITNNYNLILPENSHYSINFNLAADYWPDHYFMYTFVAVAFTDAIDSLQFIWNRNTIEGNLKWYEI